ncbi:flavin reductase family protein [Streptomyces sp. NPDC050564]|uniref:flavin reductase family protein n=1 Tax=Streptomyces sp. NPDC050564 TaxID=3365631 RepID=UPI0037B35953
MPHHLRRNAAGHVREAINVIINSDGLDARSAYKLLIGSVTPRAIGWVSTLSPSGSANLAPISFFTVVSRKPPMVSLTIQPRSDGRTLKDTFVNIRDTGEFVITWSRFPTPTICTAAALSSTATATSSTRWVWAKRPAK